CHYERVGLIWPSRTGGRQRLYSMADIERLRRLKTLTEDMGLNLAGAEIALKLMNRIEELEGEVRQLTEAVNTLQRQRQRQGQRVGQGQSPANRI
ncbi:MAG: MerR family transcriptional regulator, partial [Dehalococcoidia bacterium]|nr:MerR family transcriptional regulator [Dehalococcoidia bacterium]